MTNTPILRLTQTVEQENTFKIDVGLTGAGPRIAASARFTFELSEQERQDIRWYVEEYAEYPFAPHPDRAARVEALMQEAGTRLFRHLFEQEHQKGQQRLWAKVYENLSQMRIEVISTPQEAAALPWELLRDPFTDTAVALNAGGFVRTHEEVVRQARSVEAQPPIRILLVICRPDGRDDVPFRSVASRLVKGLSEEARAVFQLDVLRPPTFEKLSEVLRTAHRNGSPYHVVHFDGHGVYGDPNLLKQGMQVSPHAFPAGGPQGFLLFEHDDPARRLVHGIDLGNLLHETQVPLLVLNACRSAHADEVREEEDEHEAEPQQQTEDPYDKVRAFGSLAQQVMLQGVTGVVAMRYNVYVVTAAQFVADLYASLTRGFTLGEAVTFGRKQLAANPQRHIVQTIDLQDWMVPVVYEAEPVHLFAPRPASSGLNIDIKPADATPTRGDLDPDLPPEPDVGFFGRDETLLALDRGFDRQQVMLLYAYAGSGKTTTAAEFARWYSLTGGVQGPVLFTSFEQHKPLVQVLDQLGRMFDPVLRQNGLQWDAITDEAEKRHYALQILTKVPVLWLWDNVEPVAGFPAGTPSAWTDAEQRELVAFLRDARGTQAKFLLTSRRDERGWLGDHLPARVEMLPMPLHERRQLAEALADKYGVAFEQEVWRPLLVYSGGNPLTLTVVVGQALRDGLRTKEQIDAYVQQLRAGEAAFEDDESQGRTRSLGASLSYGFGAAFSEEERQTLALLHHFQGFVDGNNALRLMGNTSKDWHVHAVAGITVEQTIALLDRAAEVGLLAAYGGGFYRIHPALPWFFRRLYEQAYPDDAPARAFVEALGALGNDYHRQYNEGNRGVIAALNAEEANLLHARRLAQQHGWYRAITSTMQGLRMLYDHTGRRAEWRRLVEEIVPLFVDPASDGPLPGREAQWSLVMQYRVRLLREERQWAAAARLQGLTVDYDRQRAAPLLALPPEQLDSGQRNTLRSLAVSVEQLGHLQREQGDAACVGSYQESYELALRIGEQAGAAICAFNLGHAYKNLPALRDLAQAEQWYQRGLELTPESDTLTRGKGQGSLGSVAYERFKEARQAGQPQAVLLEHLNAALQAYQQALDMMPPDAVNERATIHNQLGVIYRNADQTEQAVAHYRESIRYDEQAGNLYGAATTRYNVALAYAQAGRFDDALLFARAALANFEQFGPAAADRAERARGLVAKYERAARGGGA